MKKLGLISFFLLTIFFVFSQKIIYTGNIIDGFSFFPIKEANIYNYSTKNYCFSDEKGFFSIEVSLNDTLIVSKSIFRQLMIVIDQEKFNKGKEEIPLYFKAIVLKEVTIFAITPSYNQFIKEVVHTQLPDYYTSIVGSRLTTQDFMNNKYAKGDYNLLNNTPMGSPISYFYEKYNKKHKNIMLAKELNQLQDEVDKVPAKYNRELVSNITGLEDEELLNFMMYCRFSYYDIIKMTPEQIIMSIRIKFSDYEYIKILQEEK
jgi:hypothetical protein